MASILEVGSDCPVEDLEDSVTLRDLEEAIESRITKTQRREQELFSVARTHRKDVSHGYGLVIPLPKIMRIPGALMAPMNIMHQNMIDKLGKVREKQRLTHNGSPLGIMKVS